MKALKKLMITGLLALPLPALAANATVYKDPNCGCCAAYVDILEEAGYEVNVENTGDLMAVKAEHGVPRMLSSCHTTLIDGYVFEGHIPLKSVERVLEERPMIRGIAVPGMPAGSPGMGGAQQGPIKVYYLADGGEPKLYAAH